MIDYDFIIPPFPRQCFFKKIMQYLENILDTLNYKILNRDLVERLPHQAKLTNLSSVISSIAYLTPSLPMPDSFTPP